jgi:hypothetical protein
MYVQSSFLNVQCIKNCILRPEKDSVMVTKRYLTQSVMMDYLILLTKSVWGFALKKLQATSKSQEKSKINIAKCHTKDTSRLLNKAFLKQKLSQLK